MAISRGYRQLIVTHGFNRRRGPCHCPSRDCDVVSDGGFGASANVIYWMNWLCYWFFCNFINLSKNIYIPTNHNCTNILNWFTVSKKCSSIQLSYTCAIMWQMWQLTKWHFQYYYDISFYDVRYIIINCIIFNYLLFIKCHIWYLH